MKNIRWKIKSYIKFYSFFTVKEHWKVNNKNINNSQTEFAIFEIFSNLVKSLGQWGCQTIKC